MLKKTLFIALVFSLSLTLGAGASLAAEKIVLGVAGAHSGDLASYGIPSINAAKLVAKDKNAQGGVLGMEVEVVSQDEQCKPELATNVATKLVSDEVNVVLGHICSGATKAALPIYTESNMVVMSPSATNPPLTKSGDYPTFFRTIAPDDAQAELAVDFTLGKLGAKEIAVLHDKGDYGKGFAEFARSFIEKSGEAEVVLFEGITPGAVDYSAVLQKVKRSGADVLIFGGYHPEASKLVTQMQRKRIKIPFVSDDGVKDDTFIKVAGKAAEGVYATGPMDVSSNPLYIKAVEDHKTEFGSEPGAFFEQAYSAALALLNAIEKAGDATDSPAIMVALRTHEVDTPVGTIKFDEKGDAIGVGFSVYQVQDGKYVELKN
jgi:branched-chain amino acid transport system substrate-binding protein